MRQGDRLARQPPGGFGSFLAVEFVARTNRTAATPVAPAMKADILKKFEARNPRPERNPNADARRVHPLISDFEFEISNLYWGCGDFLRSRRQFKVRSSRFNVFGNCETKPFREKTTDRMNKMERMPDWFLPNEANRLFRRFHAGRTKVRAPMGRITKRTHGTSRFGVPPLGGHRAINRSQQQNPMTFDARTHPTG
jgi:hypothetical protein